MIEHILGDSNEIIKTFKDNEFDIAVIDPPYGIGEDGSKAASRVSSVAGKAKGYKAYSSGDSSAPSKEFFEELFRVSKNQIIWGANHFIENLPKQNSSCWIIWDKKNESNDFADCEVAWASYSTAIRKFTWKWNGFLQGNMKKRQVRIHPNEKPFQLYEWIYKKYAEKGFKILDTHAGSLSNGIAIKRVNAFEKMNLHLTAIEMDEHYYNLSKKRLNETDFGTTLFS
jgi:site-specific DNA-methyltransferase (adenine-specific)